MTSCTSRFADVFGPKLFKPGSNRTDHLGKSDRHRESQLPQYLQVPGATRCHWVPLITQSFRALFQKRKFCAMCFVLLSIAKFMFMRLAAGINNSADTPCAEGSGPFAHGSTCTPVCKDGYTRSRPLALSALSTRSDVQISVPSSHHCWSFCHFCPEFHWWLALPQAIQIINRMPGASWCGLGSLGSLEPKKNWVHKGDRIG